ncbi:hypothetical protein CRUP_031876 [Coryphaenoides rupestris]|nr:hypothetical protein CRUP_031876 [Coryphaenoides rupestris]
MKKVQCKEGLDIYKKFLTRMTRISEFLKCTNEMNVNIPQLADTLFERTASTSWVVVFKSLTATNHLMVYGNERFIQYLASRNTLFNLSNFLDKSGLQGYDMSTFIRRYSRYLNEKAVSYRQVAFDFTKVKRGSDGVMRTVNTEKLLKTIPIIQNQMDVLLDFNVNANELTNGVINAAFMLLFKDAIRLFAAYNEGIINLLEKYFDMKKVQCKEGLDIYKKFLTRMTRISEFLKGKKVKDSTAASRASTLSHAVSSLASTGISFTKVDEREKQVALEEEQARLKALKRLKELHKNPSDADTSPGSACSSKAANDLLDLQPAFQSALPLSAGLAPSNTWADHSNPFLESSSSSLTPDLDSSGHIENILPDSFCGPGPYSNSSSSSLFQAEPPAVAGAFRGFSASSAPQPPANARGLHVDFDSVFGNKTNGKYHGTCSQGLNCLSHLPCKLVSNDLDSSLANLVGNLGIGNGMPKNDLHWSQPGEKKLTGGTNWQPKMAPSTTWSASNMAPSVMAFPATTPTGMMAYGMPPNMGAMITTAQPTMMYNQAAMRPANPFGPGAQMQFM